MHSLEQKIEALSAFKDWSNYLLVTTVAALGWVSEKGTLQQSPKWLRASCIWSFALSIFFAILTLALIPHIAELLDGKCSIFEQSWDGWGPRIELFYLCFPQHVLFLAGVMLYAVGASCKIDVPTTTLPMF